MAPKGLRELGAEAHWVLDGLPPEGREVMLSVVPPVPRFVLLHGFARSYRRAATRRWGDGAAATVPSLPLSTAREELVMGTLPRHGRTEALAAASPDAVWQVIADVTRIGQWSGECRSAPLARGASAPAPGIRFRGWNKSGPFRWTRSCVFTVVDPPRHLAWRTVGLWGHVDSTEWHITLDPRGRRHPDRPDLRRGPRRPRHRPGLLGC